MDKTAKIELDNQSFTTIAHELKSPLSLIRQLSLFLEDDQLDQKTQQKLLRQITATSDRALRLTSDLSKISNHQLELDLEPIDPVVICQQVTAELDDWYHLHQKNLKIKSKKRHYLAIANPQLLKSILINFCDNALHYAKTNSTVELTVSLHQDKVRLSVRDYGPKISKELWRQIKSDQVVSPQKIASRPQSSGLGIYIANQLAHKMNAQIGLVSHQDGVTFYVDLLNSKQLSLL